MKKTKSTLFGPAILVTAAFIGPGTVLVASTAGAKYGFSLLWAVVFSVFAAIVLQEMSARLGIVTGAGLGQAIRQTFRNSVLRIAIVTLILLAILFGNAAYQTGNLLGSAAGLSVLIDGAEGSDAEIQQAADPASEATEGTNRTPSSSLKLWTLLVGIVAWLLILFGKFELLQHVLTLLVVAMSGVFLLAAYWTHPDLGEMATGLIPSIPAGSEWFVIYLIGTTVVPYNLFLHASAAAQRWPTGLAENMEEKGRAIKDSKRGTLISLCIGGTVTAAIMVTAAMAFHGAAENSPKLDSVKAVAIQLKPALGNWAQWLFGAGLFAAGLTSAITAPVAAAYAAAGCFGWTEKLSDWRLKITASLVVLSGVVFAIVFGGSPTQTINMAQGANGLLLPIVAVFLVIISNRASLMTRFRNSSLQNVFATIVLVVVMLIAIRQLLSLIQIKP